jgi:cell wall-associated NlpC family hydrolase
MTPYFDRPERLAALALEADRWVGTPWVFGSEAVGKGTDCVRLCRSIYVATGALPASFALPTRSFHSKNLPVVKEFLAACPLFAAVTGPLAPGDLLIFADSRIHFGVVLDDQTFVHCLKSPGTELHHLHDAACMARLDSAWRPIH